MCKTFKEKDTIEFLEPLFSKGDHDDEGTYKIITETNFTNGTKITNVKKRETNENFIIKETVNTQNGYLSRSANEAIIYEHISLGLLNNNNYNFGELVNTYVGHTPVKGKRKTSGLLLKAGYHNLKQHLECYSLSNVQIKHSLFQIFRGLYASQEKLKFVHGDLHTGNVICTKLPANKSEVIYYFNGSFYHAGNCLFQLIDFENSFIQLEDGKVIQSINFRFREFIHTT
ncbi:hypothetical protein ACTFIU_004814 [Dictyostelium citrinum]